jgi:CHASE3 domain sensor protein
MGSFERSVKVYSTFNSDEMARDYQRSRSRLLEILAALENVAKDAQRVQHTQGLRDALRDIDLLVPRPLSADTAVTVRTLMESMWRLASQFPKATGEQIEAGLQRLQQSTSDAQQFLFWQSVCLTALTAVLVALFTRLSLRHLRRIENSHLPAV